MARDLTQSAIDRQNMLNNTHAIDMISSKLGFNGLLFNDEFKFTIKMVADFYEVDVRTVKRYVENFEDEIEHNGYIVLKGAKLKKFKELFGPLMSANDR